MVRSLASVVLLCFALNSGPLRAQQPVPPLPLNENAALSYWTAFALLPPIDDQLRRKIVSCAAGDVPVDNDLRELVKEGENSLKYLHRGAKIGPCGWGIAFEYGPYAYLPHLGKARELARLALLRARMRFESGQVDGAMDDTIAAIQLSRDAGQEGVIVLLNVVVGFAMETEAIKTVSNSLHLLNPSQRDQFARRLEQIEPKLDMAAALRGEKDVFVGWLVREVEGGGSQDRILDLASGDVDERIIQRVRDASQEAWVGWAKALDAIYDTCYGFMSLPPDEVNTKFGEYVAQLRDEEIGNPLAELFLPALGGARLTEAAYETQKTMLRASFALFAGDHGALDRPEYRDPFGDGPFQWKRVEGGSELISDLNKGGQPIKLFIRGLAR